MEAESEEVSWRGSHPLESALLSRRKIAFIPVVGSSYRIRAKPDPRRSPVKPSRESRSRCRGGSSPSQSRPKRRCPGAATLGVAIHTRPPGFRCSRMRTSVPTGSWTCSITWLSVMASNVPSCSVRSAAVPTRAFSPASCASLIASTSGSRPSDFHPSLAMNIRKSPFPHPTSSSRAPRPGKASRRMASSSRRAFGNIGTTSPRPRLRAAAHSPSGGSGTHDAALSTASAAPRSSRSSAQVGRGWSSRRRRA